MATDEGQRSGRARAALRHEQQAGRVKKGCSTSQKEVRAFVLL